MPTSRERILQYIGNHPYCVAKDIREGAEVGEVTLFRVLADEIKKGRMRYDMTPDGNKRQYVLTRIQSSIPNLTLQGRTATILQWASALANQITKSADNKPVFYADKLNEALVVLIMSMAAIVKAGYDIREHNTYNERELDLLYKRAQEGRQYLVSLLDMYDQLLRKNNLWAADGIREFAMSEDFDMQAAINAYNRAFLLAPTPVVEG